MKLKFIKYYLFIPLIFTACISFAQDPTFSQFNLNQFYYNPAYTGDHRGYQLAATYRTQWPNVPGKIFPGPLSTYYGLFDAYLQKGSSYTGAAGVFAMQNIEGEGFLKTTTFGASYAQHFAKIGGSAVAPRNQLSLGFKAYVSSISVNWDKLVFSDQIDLERGITGSSSFNYSGIGNKKTVDADVGLLLKNDFRGKGKWYNEVGFGMAHLFSPSLSLTDIETDQSKLPKKYTGSYRTTIGLNNERFFVGSTIVFEKQKDFHELNTGIDLYLNLGYNEIIPLWFSVMHRTSLAKGFENTNAFIGSIKYKWLMGKYAKGVYYVGFSADLPYTGLGMKSKAAYEISLGAILPRKGNNSFSRCPYSTF